MNVLNVFILVLPVQQLLLVKLHILVIQQLPDSIKVQIIVILVYILVLIVLPLLFVLTVIFKLNIGLTIRLVIVILDTMKMDHYNV